MDRLFDVLYLTDRQNVAFASFILEGEALYWWKMMRGSLGEEV